MLRTVGLLSIAAMTMGSGAPGPASKSAEEVVDFFEVEDLETAPPSDIAGTPPEPVGTSPATVPTAEASDSALAAAGSSLEIALSDDYIQGRYFTDGGLLGFDQLDGDVGVYYSDDRDVIGSLGLMSGPFSILIDDLSLSVGARGYLALLASPGSDDVVAAAPGVEARYPLPLPYPITAVGSLFYAPDILTLGDAENVVDLDLRVEAEIFPGFVGFGGYRVFRFDRDEGGSKRAANEVQLGGRFAF